MRGQMAEDENEEAEGRMKGRSEEKEKEEGGGRRGGTGTSSLIYKALPPQENDCPFSCEIIFGITQSHLYFDFILPYYIMFSQFRN